MILLLLLLHKMILRLQQEMLQVDIVNFTD